MVLEVTFQARLSEEELAAVLKQYTIHMARARWAPPGDIGDCHLVGRMWGWRWWWENTGHLCHWCLADLLSVCGWWSLSRTWPAEAGSPRCCNLRCWDDRFMVFEVFALNTWIRGIWHQKSWIICLRQIRHSSEEEWLSYRSHYSCSCLQQVRQEEEALLPCLRCRGWVWRKDASNSRTRWILGVRWVCSLWRWQSFPDWPLPKLVHA